MTHTTIIQVRLSSTLLIAVSSASVALVSVNFFDSPFGFNWGSPNEPLLGAQTINTQWSFSGVIS
jgi:hypothetical protein